MRFLLVVAVTAVVAAGCGGHKRTTFTNANYAALVAQPAKYAGAAVDFSGQVQDSAYDEQQHRWLLVYADPKHAAQATLVELRDSSIDVSSAPRVHVRGTVHDDLTPPLDFGGYEQAPVVLADSVTAE